MAWGVPVPLPDHEGKVLYVWFDAPIGYISATREWAAAQGDPDAGACGGRIRGTRLVHFIGKDNIVFHALMFPAMLMAHSEAYVLPDKCRPTSSSTSRAASCRRAAASRCGCRTTSTKFQPDPLRYTLARNLPETRDMNFTWEGFLARNDNELGNNFGNLINRVLTFIHKYFEGRCRRGSVAATRRWTARALAEVAAHREQWAEHLESFEIKAAHGERVRRRPGGQPLLRRVGAVHHAQDRPRALRHSLGVAVQIIRQIALMLAPVCPSPWSACGAGSACRRHSSRAATTRHCRTSPPAARWASRRSCSRAWTPTSCRRRSTG